MRKPGCLSILQKLANAERSLLNTRFLAPRPKGAQVRVRVNGLIKTFQTTPADFEGWGVFHVCSSQMAKLEKNATPVSVTKYLDRLVRFRLYLVRPLNGKTWLAYPTDGGSFKDRVGALRPVEVHLVTQGRAFERAVCRWDGTNFWFQNLDRRSDPTVAKRLGEALKNFVAPRALRFKGLSPELRKAYSLVFDTAEDLRIRCSETRLKKAIEMGGGRLENFTDRGDYWATNWLTSTGERHTSAIRKSDLTVMSAGICLSGEDEKFDLHSLVGVVEGADMY